MVTGYSLGRAFIYSTPEYALMKLPFQFLQAAIGAVAGMLLCWKCGVYKLYNRALVKPPEAAEKSGKNLPIKAQSNKKTLDFYRSL